MKIETFNASAGWGILVDGNVDTGIAFSPTEFGAASLGTRKHHYSVITSESLAHHSNAEKLQQIVGAFDKKSNTVDLPAYLAVLPKGDLAGKLFNVDYGDFAAAQYRLEPMGAAATIVGYDYALRNYRDSYRDITRVECLGVLDSEKDHELEYFDLENGLLNLLYYEAAHESGLELAVRYAMVRGEKQTLYTITVESEGAYMATVLLVSFNLKGN